MSPKHLSRPQQWAAAVAKASEGLEDLKALQEDYQTWLDNLPENLQQSATGELLEAICELELETAYDTVQEADGIDLPRGFGRD